MSLQALLDKCRNEVTGCDIVAFGDYHSSLILRSSQERHIRREALDTLCAEAARTFGQLDAVANSIERKEALQTFGAFNGKSTSAFARNGTGAGEFLCISGTFSTPLLDMLRLATQTLHSIETTL